MRFKDIPAHEEIKEQLRAMVDNDRLPHALLLEGCSGIGKFMLARALAQYIHCTNRTDGDSCGHCPSCLQHQSMNHIDTYYAFPVINKNDRKKLSEEFAQEWRQFLKESRYMDYAVWQDLLGAPNSQPLIYVDESAALLHRLNLTAHSSKYIVVLLWLPERMNPECANKLLKILEEPHDDTIFIFVSNESAKILPTIYSRLRRIEVRRLPEEMIVEYLTSNYPIDTAAASTIAHLSEGSVLEATKRMSTAGESGRMFELFVSLMRSAYQRKVHDLRRWADDIHALGREKAMKFFEYCERLVGENFIYNLRNPQLVYLDESESKFSANFARFINERNVMQLRKLFVDARTDVAGNASIKVVAFDVAVKVIMLLRR